MDEQEIRLVNDATATWRAASAGVRLERYLTPTNRVHQRDLVLDALRLGKRREPDFVYEAPSPELGEGLRAAADDLGQAHPLVSLLATNLRRDADLLDAARHRDGEQITRITVAEHGVPSPELVQRAEDVLRTTPRQPTAPAQTDAQAAADVLAGAIRRAELTDWRVMVDDQMSARMSVQSLERTVRVRADAWFSDDEVRRLIVHELGTHVARSVNGSTQLLHILATGLPGYLATEEGLAAWHEERAGLSDPATIRRYALRVIAADRALRSGFGDTLAEIADHTVPDEAFDIVQRAKRGFLDMTEPGAHVKDQVYLRGLDAVAAHLEASPEEHRLLLAGKFGLEHLPLIRSLDRVGLLRSPAVAPEDFATPR